MLLIILVVQSTDGVITYRLVSSHSCYRRYYSLFLLPHAILGSCFALLRSIDNV